MISSHDTVKEAQGVDSTTLPSQSNPRKERDILYYVKQDCVGCSNDVNSRMVKDSKILNQLAELLKQFNYPFERVILNCEPKKQRVIIWDHPTSSSFFYSSKVRLRSTPFYGQNAFTIDVFSVGAEGRYSYQFFASSHFIAFHKLVNLGLLPKKKGGANG